MAGRREMESWGLLRGGVGLAGGVARAWPRNRFLGRGEAGWMEWRGGERSMGRGSKKEKQGSELRLTRVEIQKARGRLGAESGQVRGRTRVGGGAVSGWLGAVLGVAWA